MVSLLLSRLTLGDQIKTCQQPKHRPIRSLEKLNIVVPTVSRRQIVLLFQAFIYHFGFKTESFNKLRESLSLNNYIMMICTIMYLHKDAFIPFRIPTVNAFTLTTAIQNNMRGIYDHALLFKKMFYVLYSHLQNSFCIIRQKRKTYSFSKTDHSNNPELIDGISLALFKF